MGEPHLQFRTMCSATMLRAVQAEIEEREVMIHRAKLLKAQDPMREVLVKLDNLLIVATKVLIVKISQYFEYYWKK